MDYEHDDRRATDVPGASGAEGSGLPAGREPLDAGSPSSRSPEVRAFDPREGSGLSPSEMTASGQADDLFDAMFLTGGFRSPGFAAVDHDLGFPPPQGPDLASAFLAALDAIDDRRFVTPVPEEPPAAHRASVEPAPGEPAYELRLQSQLELESEVRPEPVGETVAEPVPVTVEGAEPLPWDTAGRVPVAGLLSATDREAEPEPGPEPEPAAASHERAPAEETWAFASYLESEADLQARAAAAATPAIDEAEERAFDERVEASAGEGFAGAIEETAAHVLDAGALEDELEDEAAALTHAAISAEEHVEEFAYAADSEPIEEAAYFGAGRIGDDSEEFEEEDVMALSAAGFGAALGGDADADAAAAAVAVAGVDADAGFGAADAVAGVDADAAAEEAAAYAADAYAVGAYAAVDAHGADADADAAPAVADAAAAYAAAGTDEDADADAEAEAEALILALAEAEAELDAVVAAEPTFDVTPEDDDFELEPAIGMEPIDAAPMTFDGPDAFAPAPLAVAEPEPEPESDELEDLQDFVVFSLGDLRCVVPIRNVVEVGRIPDAAPVPNAPAWLYGLGNLRGQVLSLIDLRALFGVGRIKASAGRMVVLRGDSDDITAGVMVDQVHQIVALSPSRFKEAPAELPLPDRSTEFVWGACDYGNFTMIGLDVDGVLGVESMTEETV